MRREITPFKAGLLALMLLAVLTYFGFTKSNPFVSPFELQAVFDNVNNLQPRSPVRIAGVDVGKVTEVEPLAGDDGAARVTMEIQDRGLPIHRDATVKVRSRIFLEGNFFVDIQPGSPGAAELDDGDTIPISHTAAPVQFGQLLSVLESDTREDLKTFLREYSRGLAGEGARGFNQSIRYWAAAYRGSALTNDATLGEDPAHDLRRVLTGQQRTFAALSTDERALRELVTNFNVTAAAFARQDEALSASVPALRDTLRAAQPALASLNGALPPLRRFAVDALPGVRSSAPTLEAAIPFIRQARKLVSPAELRGLAAVLRRRVDDLVGLNQSSVALSKEGRQLSACTNEVLVPFLDTPVPEPEMAAAGNSNQRVLWQIQRAFVGLAGESRMSDGNNQTYHTSAVAPSPHVIPAPPPDGGNLPPAHRPDVPCETQEKPDLAAPSADSPELTFSPTVGARYVRSGPAVSPERFQAAVLRAKSAWPEVERAMRGQQLKNLRFFKERAR